ncbi:MAG: TauD/TfdA family dioxygenase [Polyangiales bacterium]
MTLNVEQSAPASRAVRSQKLPAALEVHPVTPLIGAEVTGIDLREELSAETVAALRAKLLQHKVLIFRDQPITPEQQVRFTRYFGPVTPAHPITNGQRELPELKVNNLLESRSEYASRDISVEQPLRTPRRRFTRTGWHIDITFVANPASITLLRGVEIPAYGGDTLFANLEGLYELLSPSLQRFLDGLQAIHVRADHNPEPRFDGREPGPFAALHPLVTIHPETGKKVLFLSGFIQAIHGLRPSESDALLGYLNDELSGRVELQLRYRWTKDSIAVWDNRVVTHAGPVDGALIQGNRIVHRTTVGGELTRGPDGFVSRPLVGELFNTIS